MDYCFLSSLVVCGSFKAIVHVNRPAMVIIVVVVTLLEYGYPAQGNFSENAENQSCVLVQ